MVLRIYALSINIYGKEHKIMKFDIIKYFGSVKLDNSILTFTEITVIEKFTYFFGNKHILLSLEIILEFKMTKCIKIYKN